MQTDALKKAGCEKIFTDKMGGAFENRKGLKDALSHLRKGDTLDAGGDKSSERPQSKLETKAENKERGEAVKEIADGALNKDIAAQTLEKRLSRKSGATDYGVASADSLLPLDKKNEKVLIAQNLDGLKQFSMDAGELALEKAGVFVHRGNEDKFVDYKAAQEAVKTSGLDKLGLSNNFVGAIMRNEQHFYKNTDAD